MKTEAFDYDLPVELIAQEPLAQRDASRLLVLRRKEGTLEHTCFRQLPLYLERGDLLVMNDTRVFPARLLGRQDRKGGSVELLLLRPLEDGKWEALCKPGKRAKPGEVLVFGDAELRAEVLTVTPTGERIVSLHSEKPLETILSSIGQVPLPPYIKKELYEPERYQTVYARHSGSVAAPTAGLHFTERVFSDLQQRDVGLVFLTLHVGVGTFRPVKEEYVTQHRMHSEWFSLSPEAVEQINRTKEKGGRIVSVGTTSCRVLETLGDNKGRIRSGEGETDLYIYPGYRFKIVDALLTNFHLPRSTLLMLVSAFASRELILHAYAEAVRERYRFFSFGDAMLII